MPAPLNLSIHPLRPAFGPAAPSTATLIRLILSNGLYGAASLMLIGNGGPVKLGGQGAGTRLLKVFGNASGNHASSNIGTALPELPHRFRPRSVKLVTVEGLKPRRLAH